MGCPNAPDRNIENAFGGTHKWKLIDDREGQVMNPCEPSNLVDFRPRYKTNLYQCVHCGRIEAM